MADDDKIRLEMDESDWVRGAKSAEDSAAAIKTSVDATAKSFTDLVEAMHAGTATEEEIASLFKSQTDAAAKVATALEDVDRTTYDLAKANETVIETEVRLADVMLQEDRELAALIQKNNEAAYAKRAMTTILEESAVSTKAVTVGMAGLTVETKLAEAATINTGAAMQAMGHIATEVATGRVYGLMGSIQRLTAAISPEMAGAGLVAGGLIFALYEARHAIMESYNEWTGYNAKVESAKDVTERLKDEIKKLNETPLKTTVQMEDLENLNHLLERSQAAFKSYKQMMEGEPTLQKEAGKRAGKAFEEAPEGGAAITTALVNAELAKSPYQAQVVEQRQAMARREAEIRTEAGKVAGVDPAYAVARSKEAGELGEMERQLKVMEKVANDMAKERVGEIREGVIKGIAADRDEMVSRLREIGKKDIAARISTSTPENIQEEEIDKLTDTITKEQSHARGKEITQAAHDAKTQMSEANRRARANAELTARVIRETGKSAVDAQKEATDILAAKEAADAQGATPDAINQYAQAEDRLKEEARKHADALKAPGKAAKDKARDASREEKAEDRADAKEEGSIERRAMALMRSGIDATTATQEAQIEAQLLASKMMQQWANTVNNANAIAARTRQMMHQMEKASQENTQMNWGGP